MINVWIDEFTPCLKGMQIGEIVQFAIDEENAKKIMEVYDYEWTDEQI